MDFLADFSRCWLIGADFGRFQIFRLILAYLPELIWYFGPRRPKVNPFPGGGRAKPLFFIRGMTKSVRVARNVTKLFLPNRGSSRRSSGSIGSTGGDILCIYHTFCHAY